MRKTILTALVVLLLMLAVSCENGLETVKPDGGLFTLTVNTGESADSSRSITNNQAKSEANMVEVIVKNGTEYYRAIGLRGDSIQLRVPQGTYNATNTLILIGRRSDSTLLAVGTATNEVTLPKPTTGTPATTLTFTATSLTTTLTANATGCNFVIDPSTVPATTYSEFSGKLDKGSFLGDDSSPCFQVPTGVTGDGNPITNVPIAASLTFAIDDITTATTSLPTANLSTIGDRIVVVNKQTADPDPVKFTTVSGPDITPTDVTPATADNMSSGKISFKFVTSTTAGKYRITFYLPVVGFSTNYVAGRGTEPLTWHIRGGTELGAADYGDIGDFKTAVREGVPLIVTDTPTSVTYDLPGTITYW